MATAKEIIKEVINQINIDNEGLSDETSLKEVEELILLSVEYAFQKLTENEEKQKQKNQKFETQDFKLWLFEIYGISEKTWGEKTQEEREEIYTNYELGGGASGLGV